MRWTIELGSQDGILNKLMRLKSNQSQLLIANRSVILSLNESEAGEDRTRQPAFDSIFFCKHPLGRESSFRLVRLSHPHPHPFSDSEFLLFRSG
jgi:hypothetical protein